MTRINWKARALKAEAERDKAEAYAYDYGNATHECRGGYLQQNGLICHHCSADVSAGDRCPKAPKP